MIQIYTHPACLAHDPGDGHPESPSRLRAVLRALESAHPDLDWQQAPCVSRGQLLRVHDAELIDLVLSSADALPKSLDPDTRLSVGSSEAALRAAGACVTAVDAVLYGHAQRAFCAVRPPGHHATTNAAMGFCIFNNVAIAARHAIDKHGLERVAIVDFDVHHGNGTQAIFQDVPKVLFASSHQWPLYPESGARSETGCGNLFNAPLPAGSGSEAFRDAWRSRLLPAVADFRPQLLLISAGFDAHRRDPMAALQLDAGDFSWITRELVQLADRHCAGRIVSTLEGGYDLEALADSCLAHVDALRY